MLNVHLSNETPLTLRILYPYVPISFDEWHALFHLNGIGHVLLEREGSEKFKMKINVSRVIGTSNVRTEC